MNMKKILASVAASALAVTSLAAVASAKEFVGAPGKNYTATITYSATDHVTLTDGKATIEAKVTPAQDYKVDNYSVKLVIVTGANDKATTVEKEKTQTDGTKSITYAVGESTTDTTGAVEIKNVQDGAEYTLFYTVNVSSDKKEITKDTAAVTVIPAATGGVLSNAASADTPAGVQASPIVIHDKTGTGNTLTNKEYKAINDNGAIVNVTFVGKGDVEFANETVSVTVSVANDEKTTITVPQFISKGQTVVVPVEIPAGKVATVDADGDADYKDITISYSASTNSYVTKVTLDPKAGASNPPVESDDDDDDDNKPENTTKPADKPNDGNGSGNAGSDPNPGTGVVLAVIPAIVAASGVIIFKKRK